MSLRHLAALACACLIVIFCAATFTSARAQLLTPRADQVRFELVSNEPVAAPDNKSVVAGWFATVLRDRKSGKCFLAVTEGHSVSLAPVECH